MFPINEESCLWSFCTISLSITLCGESENKENVKLDGDTTVWDFNDAVMYQIRCCTGQ